jgi:O-antigen/teichoic acid export membrane protein
MVIFKEILGTLLRPTVWVTAEKAFAELFWLVLFAVQAPLLGPYAFGLMAAVMVFVNFWEGVPCHAFTEALVSIRKIEHIHFNTVTTTFALLCVVFGAAVFELAGPLATVFGDAELTSVMRVMAVLPLLQALSITPIAAAQRDLRFQSLTIRTIVSLLAGGVVGLVLAVAGTGVWALVSQALVQRFVAVIVLWAATPFPLRFAISPRHLRELATFAMPTMLASAMNWASGQFPRLILGMYLGAAELGLFSLATRLNSIINQVAIGPRALVARIDLRRFATDPQALTLAARRVFLHIGVLSFPLCIGGAAVTPTLFHAWLDPRWYAAIIPSQLMLLTCVPYVTFYVATSVLLALNRQKSEAFVATTQGVGILIAVVVGSPFGLVATAAAIAVVSLATVPLPILVIQRKCGLSLRDILLPQAPAFLAACLMGGVVVLLGLELNAALTSAAVLSIIIPVGATFYAILLAVMMPWHAIQAFKSLRVLIVRTTAPAAIDTDAGS